MSKCFCDEFIGGVCHHCYVELKDKLDAINKSLSTMRKTVWKSADMDAEMTEEYKLGAIWVFHCLELALEDIKESKG